VNLSGWSRRLVIAVLAGVNFVLAGHLALFQWGVIDAVWDPVFGPQQSRAVLESAFSATFHRVFLIPDAALGTVAYFAEMVLSLVGSSKRWREHPWLVALFGANALAVTLVGLTLVVLQAAVIKSWCFLCLLTAAISMVMFLLALPEAWASWKLLRRTRLAWYRIRHKKEAIS